MNARPPAWIGPRGIVALAVLAITAGLAAGVIAWPFVIIGAALIAAIALAADWAAIAAGLEISRTIPARLMLARPAEFAYTIVNRCDVAVRFAIFEAAVNRVAVDPVAARASVAARARTSVMIGFVPRERGRTELGVAFAWFESPLGFVRRRVRVGSATRVHIRPDLSALGRDGDLALRARLLDAGLRRIRRRGSGNEFESLRDYSSGDSFRTIDWKATARRGRLMVAQYEVERSQQIVIAIDAGRLMSPRLGDRRKLDYAVSAALAIASLARLAADRIGLHAFAGTTLAALAARTGAAHTAALTDALSDLEPHFEESDYERAALELRRRFGKRSLIVVFTDLFDPIASSAVLASLALLAPHHLVLVVLMNDAAIGDAIARVPVTPGDVYRAGVATRLADERARAVALLQDRGIGVVDVPARDLTLALLDAYVDVKTRALL